MKYILIIALLCASVSGFSQVDTRIIKGCGYSSENIAFDGYLWSHYTAIMPDEHEVTNSYSLYENSSGQWCYKYTVYCTAPLSKEPVPDVTKVIKSLPCNIKEPD